MNTKKKEDSVWNLPSLRTELFQKHPNQLIIQFGTVGLVPHRQIQPSFFMENTFTMGKGFKANLAVVTAHTAFAHAPKAHIGGGKMHNNIVNATAPVGNTVGDFFDMGFVLGEQIQCQGFGFVLQQGEQFFPLGIGEDG